MGILPSDWLLETVTKNILRKDKNNMNRKAFLMGLICYFETTDGIKYKLFCFRHTKNGEDQYRPKRCEVDFEKVDDDTWWRCTLAKNKKGNCTWIAAEPME